MSGHGNDAPDASGTGPALGYILNQLWFIILFIFISENNMNKGTYFISTISLIYVMKLIITFGIKIYRKLLSSVAFAAGTAPAGGLVLDVRHPGGLRSLHGLHLRARPVPGARVQVVCTGVRYPGADNLNSGAWDRARSKM